jgi:hypothetical protein
LTTAPLALFLYVARCDLFLSRADHVRLQLGSITFATKAAFIAASAEQPEVPFTVLQTWHTCDTVIIRWVANPGPQQVQGLDAIIVEPSSNDFQPYQIKVVYGEFNSGAWFADLGYPECANV